MVLCGAFSDGALTFRLGMGRVVGENSSIIWLRSFLALLTRVILQLLFCIVKHVAQFLRYDQVFKFILLLRVDLFQVFVFIVLLDYFGLDFFYLLFTGTGRYVGL